MTNRYIASIDQGTTSSRCILFDERGRIVSVGQREHRQIFPKPGWVEHDAVEIWHNVLEVVQEALSKAQLTPADIVALGITNQRETTVVWDRATGAPVQNAIDWQDIRTDHLIHELAARRGAGPLPRALRPAARDVLRRPQAPLAARPRPRPARARRGRRGAVRHDGRWLIWNLTGRHVTDVTNASRTMLMNLRTLEWDDTLLDALGVPRAMLPEIRPSAEVYGEATGALAGVPVAGALGDQQAALFGQTCFAPGEGKCTYGTGSFLLLNTGEQPVTSANGLLTTVGYKIGDAPPTYALEGSIAVTGALVQWFRDNLGVIGTRARDRDARPHGRGQRRLLLRARVLRAVRPALAQRRPRRDRRPDRLHHQGPPRPRRAGGDRRGRPARWSTR